VGGDGSVNEIARGLLHISTRLAIIPTGSGNGLARHLKIPLNLKEAINLINKGNTQQIDAVQINKEHFFCTAGAGFDAHVSWQFAKVKKRGFWSYFKITVSSFFNYNPTDYKLITSESTTTLKNVVLATLANANQFGNNVVISPHSVINDGFVRLIIIRKFPFYHTPFLIYYLLSKKIDRFKYFTEYKLKNFSLITQSELLHIDGEPVKLDKELKINVASKAVNVITP
jgi:diacylglycerol kinase family enzyme